MNQCACAEINTTSEDSEDRVGLIADISPDCGCEQHQMSEHSPCPVSDEETIVRMVCVPMHVHKKKAELLPNFFNHAFTRGMSAQRLDASTDDELANWVNNFLTLMIRGFGWDTWRRSALKFGLQET